MVSLVVLVTALPLPWLQVDQSSPVPKLSLFFSLWPVQGWGMLFWVTEPAGWDLQVPQGWVVLCGRTWWGHQNLPGQGSVGCWNRAVLCLLLLGLELGLGLGLKLEWIIFNQNHSRIPLTPDSPRAQPVVSLLSPRVAHPAPGGL